MDLQKFEEQGGCEGCTFYHVVDAYGRRECAFNWSDDESDDWNFGKNCDEIAE